MPSVVMPSVVMPSVIMSSIVMPSVTMPSVVMPSIVRLSIEALQTRLEMLAKDEYIRLIGFSASDDEKSLITWTKG
jgi:hypothetical protein